jgi:hypothetical protein
MILNIGFWNKIKMLNVERIKKHCCRKLFLSIVLVITVVFSVPLGAYAAVTDLTDDFKANSLTVNQGDEFYTNGYEVDIANGDLTVDTGGKFDALDDVETDETIITTASGFSVNLAGYFIPDQSTLIFDDTSGTNTFVTAGTAPVYNLTLGAAAGVIIQVQDPVVVENDVVITAGTLDTVSGESNQINVAGDWTCDDTFEARSGKVLFDGTSSINLDSGCSDEDTCTSQDFYDLEIDKSSVVDANDDVNLLNTHLKVTNTLTITDGELVQGAMNVRAEGGTSVSVTSKGKWTNISTGNLTLGGSVSNSGTMTLQGNGATCGQNDDITIASTAASQRSWTGSGTYNVNDVSVSYQAGTSSIEAYSSFNGGNNGANWDFVACPTAEVKFNFENLNLEDLNIN